MVNCVDCIYRGKCKFNRQINLEIDGSKSALIKVACSEGKTSDDQGKLDEINTIVVNEYDSDIDGTMIYVCIDDNDENVSILKQLGATKEDFELMRANEDNVEFKQLDISTFGFNNLNADRWSVKDGFYFTQDTE